jgi:hypothetical protein
MPPLLSYALRSLDRPSCQDKLAEFPFSGCVFVFRSGRGTAIRLLSYDGQGCWMAQKRLPRGGLYGGPQANCSSVGKVS